MKTRRSSNASSYNQGAAFPSSVAAAHLPRSAYAAGQRLRSQQLIRRASTLVQQLRGYRVRNNKLSQLISVLQQTGERGANRAIGALQRVQRVRVRPGRNKRRDLRKKSAAMSRARSKVQAFLTQYARRGTTAVASGEPLKRVSFRNISSTFCCIFHFSVLFPVLFL